MAIDRIRELGRGGDLMTRNQVIDLLAEQRAGMERLIAATLGRYHERYHGTPALPEKPEQTS